MNSTMRAGGDEAPAMLAVNLSATNGAPGAARAAIVEFCRNREIASSPIATVMLLVSEVVTNAVVHPDLPATATIALAARVEERLIRVEVTDQGTGFVPRPRDPSRTTGGFGLYLLEKESRDWGVLRKNGTCVWFEVAI